MNILKTQPQGNLQEAPQVPTALRYFQLISTNSIY